MGSGRKVLSREPSRYEHRNGAEKRRFPVSRIPISRKERRGFSHPSIQGKGKHCRKKGKGPTLWVGRLEE